MNVCAIEILCHVIMLFELVRTTSANVTVSCLYHYSSRGRKTHESEGVFSAKKCIAWFHEYTGMSNAIFLTHIFSCKNIVERIQLIVQVSDRRVGPLLQMITSIQIGQIF